MHPLTEDISKRASDHSEVKHVKEFSDPKLGPPQNVADKKSLKEHTARVLESKDTRCFTAFVTEKPARQADIFFHKPSNTMVIAPLSPQDPPTVFRPKNFEKHYEAKLDSADKIEKSRTITEKRGIHELHPVLEKQQSKALEMKEPEKLQFKRDVPREQEKGPSQEKPKSPEKANEPEKLVFKRDTDKDHGRGR